MSHQQHITDYEVLSGSDPESLQKRVQTAIHNGWQPWGAFAISTLHGDQPTDETQYLQAVVKYSEWFR